MTPEEMKKHLEDIKPDPNNKDGAYSHNSNFQYPHPQTCPSCGYCPTCGRGRSVWPNFQQPYYYYQGPTCGSHPPARKDGGPNV